MLRMIGTTTTAEKLFPLTNQHDRHKTYKIMCLKNLLRFGFLILEDGSQCFVCESPVKVSLSHRVRFLTVNIHDLFIFL